MRRLCLPLSSALYAERNPLVLKMFDQTVYVQVMKNELAVLNVQKNKQVHIQAVKPFSTERLAVGHFNPAAETLKKGFAQVYSKSLFSPSPVVVMHQLYITSRSRGLPQPALLRSIAPVGYVSRCALHSVP
jgi:hypothetical protein